MNQCMKFLIFSAFVFPLLFSCEKEPENIFLGTWELSEFRLDCPEEGIANLSVAASDGCMQFQGETFCITISFETETQGMLSFSDGGNDNSLQAFSYTFNDTNDIVSMCVEVGDCDEVQVEDGRLVIRESDPECPAEYFLDKK